MTINDGTAEFKTRDLREIALFDLLYPVGIIVSTTSETVPFSVGTWEEVGKGRVLQGCGTGQTAGETVEAGLPNITGYTTAYTWLNPPNQVLTGGAMTQKLAAEQVQNFKMVSDNQQHVEFTSIAFNAAIENSIYGASDTVQPPAYLVHFWRRKA